MSVVMTTTEIVTLNPLTGFDNIHLKKHKKHVVNTSLHENHRKSAGVFGTGMLGNVQLFKTPSRRGITCIHSYEKTILMVSES